VARNRKRAKERRARRPQPVGTTSADRREAPDPIEHASPDAELAEAQLALGRPELSDEADGDEPALGIEEPEEEEADLEEIDQPLPRAEVAAPRASTPARLVNFVQGSWRELQRVQWPDRRQVMQATGVVIGFVIIAGAFLGVADALAGKLMDFILK
jgi:preprotein translocase SecE subunit